MRTKRYFQQHMARAMAKGVLLLLAAMLLTPISLAATPSQAGVSWDYKLLGKLNSAHNPDTHLTIVITGSGSLDLSLVSINGGGSYTILDAEGSVVGSGTWKADDLHDFTSMGPGNSPGEGGHLELMASFKGSGTGALNGPLHVVIQCSMWGPEFDPSSYPWPADFVKVGPYSEPLTGAVMFNLNQ